MTKTFETEVLTFQDQETGAQRVASVVTDGVNVRTYEYGGCKAHATLRRALAYLEVRGYRIIMDNYNGE